MTEVVMLDSFQDALLSPAREKVFNGGSGSGKTHTVQQYAILRGMEEPNIQTLVVMETIPGVLTDMFYPMRNMLESYGVPYEARETVPMRITLPNGHELLFTSADKTEKLKHYTNVKRVIINEATGIKESDFNQLMNRMGRTYSGAEIIFTFNPIDEHHWLVERYVNKALEGKLPPGVVVHHSTYHDNPFLSREWVEWLENMVNVDENFYRVYALGLPGHLEGLVYKEGTNWTHKPLSEWPQFVTTNPPRFLGVDFGYNDPTAVVGIWEFEGKRYAHELLYQSFLTVDEVLEQIKILFRHNQWPLGIPMYCDSARPEIIESLCRIGYKAMKSNKDIAYGISLVKSMPLVVSDESQNTIKEFRNYRWEQDKKNEKVFLDKPVDAFNHMMDAIRYAISSTATNVPTRLVVKPAAAYRNPYAPR